MMRQAYYEAQQWSATHLPDPIQLVVNEGCTDNSVKYKGIQDFIREKEMNEKIDQIDWAIHVLEDNFGPGLKRVIMSYLDSKTEPFNQMSVQSIDDKSELQTKFELYKIENIAFEQREMIVLLKEQIEILKTQLTETQNHYENNQDQLRVEFNNKIREYKTILNRLSLYLNDKNSIVQLFNFMRRKPQETKLRKMAIYNNKLKLKLNEIRHENNNLVSKEIETEKDISHILNTQIECFKDKTFNFLLEKSIIKSKDNNNYNKTLVDKGINTSKPARNSFYSSKIISRNVSKDKERQPGPLGPLLPSRTKPLKCRTKSCQTLVPEDLLSICRMPVHNTRFCR